jgi:hypothetical protein
VESIKLWVKSNPADVGLDFPFKYSRRSMTDSGMPKDKANFRKSALLASGTNKGLTAKGFTTVGGDVITKGGVKSKTGARLANKI